VRPSATASWSRARITFHSAASAVSVAVAVGYHAGPHSLSDAAEDDAGGLE